MYFKFKKNIIEKIVIMLMILIKSYKIIRSHSLMEMASTQMQNKEETI